MILPHIASMTTSNRLPTTQHHLPVLQPSVLVPAPPSPTQHNSFSGLADRSAPSMVRRANMLCVSRLTIGTRERWYMAGAPNVEKRSHIWAKEVPAEQMRRMGAVE
jgi:hypothetical protein